MQILQIKILMSWLTH